MDTEDVAADGTMTIGARRLYHVVHLAAAERATVTITFTGPAVHLYSFTFGG